VRRDTQARETTGGEVVEQIESWTFSDLPHDKKCWARFHESGEVYVQDEDGNRYYPDGQSKADARPQPDPVREAVMRRMENFKRGGVL
jgi:hypothetical protein